MSDIQMRLSFVLFIVCLLSGCALEPDKEVQALVRNARAQPTEDPTPLPEFKEEPSFFYEASALKDPFANYGSSVATHLPNEQDASLEGRAREPLEYFPIESLKMVGYLEKNQVFCGLVKDKQGTIHKVSVDHYIGQNNGKVIKICPDGMDIEEIDAAYEKRTITLSLSQS